MKNIFWILLALTFSFYAKASAPDLSYPAIDMYKVHKQDLSNEKLGNAPRFALEHQVHVNPMQMNSWTEEDGIWVWRYRVFADRAVSLNFAFDDFQMSEHSVLRIYSPSQINEMRDFTFEDNNEQHELWTPVVMGEEAIIELRVPENEMSLVRLSLSQVNQGYRTFSQPTFKSGSCNIDVVCKEGDDWRNQIDAVAVISTGGSTFCTGFMVNNTSNDRTPYFMTANHCRITAQSAPSLVVYWNYQASSCGGRRDGVKQQFNTGSTWLAGSAKSDFTLVKLNRNPSKEWNVSYAGWDAAENALASATAIHHPGTDEKSISFEFDPPTVTSYLGEDIPGNGTHIRIEDWDVGTTEPGSSGSPLFNQDQRVIGQLHGGYASCSSQTSDWYGRFHTSWEGEGSENNRLKDWLDSSNTGQLQTDTIY